MISSLLIKNGKKFNFFFYLFLIVLINSFIDDEDQPYSPGGSDNESDFALPSITRPQIINKPPEEIEKQISEINRQIEAAKMGIEILTDNVNKKLIKSHKKRKKLI